MRPMADYTWLWSPEAAAQWHLADDDLALDCKKLKQRLAKLA